VAVACVRFKGQHSYDKIAQAISHTHANYSIKGKVIFTCTGNGSNIVKAFAESTKAKERAQEQATDASCETEDDDYSEEDLETGYFDTGIDEALTTYKMDADSVILPDRVCCCLHTLNLVATSDAEKVLSDATFKKVYRQSMAKASAIWNLTSRSTKAADAAFDIVGKRFTFPCVTQWNSFYEAVKSLLSCEGKLIDVCKALSLPPFVQIEIKFLTEYLLLMAPIAQSIDILQGDQTCCLGFALPTLTTLKEKLQWPELKHANVLHDSLLQGINKRFDSYFQEKEFLLAAVTHPRFKLSWSDDSTLQSRYTELLEDAVNVLAEKKKRSFSYS
jgi:hypothetical protein